MKQHIVVFRGRVAKRLAPFFDLTAWILLLVSIIPLLLIDPATVVTLGQWTAYALALAGIAVVISRVVLPQLSLSEWAEHARKGSVAAGLVILSICIVLSTSLLALVLWAKA